MTLVAVYANHRPNAGPFLRGPLRETQGEDSYWVTVGYQSTPGAETSWARYPAENVTVVPLDAGLSEEMQRNPLYLGFTSSGDTGEGVPLSNGTSRHTNTTKKAE